MQITLHRGGVLLVIAKTKFYNLITPFLLAPLVASPLAKQDGASVSPPEEVRMPWELRCACKGHSSHFSKLLLLLPMLETTL